jgi:hypothetical protein
MVIVDMTVSITDYSFTCAPYLNGLLGGQGMPDTQEERFGEVLSMLERERFEGDLRRLTIAADYLRALLPKRGRSARCRCSPRR